MGPALIALDVRNRPELIARSLWLTNARIAAACPDEELCGTVLDWRIGIATIVR